MSEVSFYLPNLVPSPNIYNLISWLGVRVFLFFQVLNFQNLFRKSSTWVPRP